jgi:diamine N-acetyltransferase
VDGTESVVVEPVDAENWRAVVKVAATQDQERFVMPVSWYLALCEYGGLGWNPYAIRRGDEYVGFVMAGVDDEENSYWIGGFVIDATHQRRGYGRQAMQVLLKWGTELDCDTAGLSYEPENGVAKALYAGLGFLETGETSDDGVVARLQLRK